MTRFLFLALSLLSLLSSVLCCQVNDPCNIGFCCVANGASNGVCCSEDQTCNLDGTCQSDPSFSSNPPAAFQVSVVVIVIISIVGFFVFLFVVYLVYRRWRYGFFFYRPLYVGGSVYVGGPYQTPQQPQYSYQQQQNFQSFPVPSVPPYSVQQEGPPPAYSALDHPVETPYVPPVIKPRIYEGSESSSTS